jgi:protoheme IX farnesyltransferase
MSGKTLTRTTGIESSHGLHHYLELMKPHLCLYIGLSSVFGHVMARQNFSPYSLLLGILVFVLACGSAVLNNIQDRKYDAFFPRTSGRSLPQKRVPLSHAGLICLAMISSGLAGLWFFMGKLPFFWGAVAVFAYNGVYTPLKKQSLFAILPGTMSGMLPPLIGWTASGQPSLLFTDILAIMAVFGLWQVSHFFIILLKTEKSGPKTKSQARFPSGIHVFSKNEIKVQILIWTSLYSLGILLFLVNGSIHTPLLAGLTGVNAILITPALSVMVFRDRFWNQAFAAINLSVLCFMGAGIWDKCFF